MNWADHSDWLIVGGLLVLPLALWVGYRLAGLAWGWWRDAAHVRAAKQLESFRDDDFADTSAVIARLGRPRTRRRFDAIDGAINRELNFARGQRRKRLVTISRAVGVVDRHLERVHESRDWVQRAESAYSLGRHRLIEGIPLLVTTLRNPDELKNVKIAAAQALLLMRSVEAVPTLVSHFVVNDNWASPLIAEVLQNIGEAAIPGMLDALGDESLAGARVWLTRILAQSDYPEVNESLLLHLDDRADYVRVAVIEALERLDQPESIAPLVQTALRDPVEHVRLEAVRAAAAIGEHLALQRLVTCLHHPDYAVRLRVIDAVESMQPADPECLYSALGDPSAEVRTRAARALENLGIVEELVRQLAWEDDRAVTAALGRLHRIGKADCADALTPFLAFPDWRVRLRLADLLGELGDPRTADALQPLLEDRHQTVRASTARALATLRPRDGVTRLAAALDDEDEAVRAIAATALESLEPPTDEAGIAEMLQLYGQARPELRRAILGALESVSGPAVDDVLRQGLVDVDGDVRLEATRRTAERADPSWFDDLAQRLVDVHPPIRAAAARGLGAVGTAPALALLARHLDTPDRPLREALTDALATFGSRAFAPLIGRSDNKERKLALIWTLGKMASPSAADQLISLAEDAEASVRAAVAGALGRYPDNHRVGATLLGLLSDPNERVRAASANALGKRPASDGLARTLGNVLSDPDMFVRGRAALALGQVGGDLATQALRRALFEAESREEQAHIVVGLVLTSNHVGLATALHELEAEGTEADVRALLDQEPDEIREAFRRSLRLEVDGRPRPGTGLTAGDLPENYVHTLTSSRWVAARASAVAALRSLGAMPHIDLLVGTLRTDPAPEVRLMALEALSDLDDQRLTDWYGQALNDRDVHVKIRAASGLLGRCRPEHMAALLQCFELRSSELDEPVIRALASVDDADVPGLLDVIRRQKHPAVRAGAAVALAALGDQRAIPLASEWLASGDPDVRAESARTLAELPAPEARRALVQALNGADTPVILDILEVIPSLVDLVDLGPLAALGTHASSKVRSALARAAGRGPYPMGVEITERLCWDADHDVRVQALLTLLFERDSEALERFTVIARRQPDAVKQRLRGQPALRLAVVSLRAMAGTHRDKALRAAAIGALEAVGDRPRKLLVRALNDPAREVRVAAAEALGDIDVPEVQAALKRLRDDPNEAVRDAARTQRIRVPNPRHTPAPGWEIIRLPNRSRRRRRTEKTWT